MESDNQQAREAVWRELLADGPPSEEKFEHLNAYAERVVNDAPRQVLGWLPALIEEARLSGDPHPERHGYWIRSMAYHMLSDYDEALVVLREGMALAEAIGDRQLQAGMLGGYAGVYLSLGDFEKALTYGQQAIDLLSEVSHGMYRAWLLHGFGVGYFEMGDLERALGYYDQSLALFEAGEFGIGQARALSGIGAVHQRRGEYALAIDYFQRALALFREEDNASGEARALHDLGCVYLQQERFEEAEKSLLQGLAIRRQIENTRAVSTSLLHLGRLYIRLRRYDEAEEVLQRTLTMAEELGVETRNFESHEALAELYELRGDSITALAHYKAYHASKELVFSEELRIKMSNLQIRLAVELSEREAAWVRTQNELLEEKNERLEALLTELKAAQEQLIQGEKMSSLGQLTAGIAHEIKNPLNFVNNFASLSVELVEELIAFLDSHPDALVRQVRDELADVLNDLGENASRIQQHGKRADRIVHGMLELARGVSGEWREVDLNLLLEEYTGLAYHGARAQDSSFNVTIDKTFDPAVGQVRMVSQDIGRVLLNLLSNAFHAVNARRKAGEAGYLPRVKLITRREGDTVVVRVEDNGVGIPESVYPRIFNPFFTTKPPGEGTGLGLSLSYDIVTQGHRGALRADPSVADGAAFEMTLPAGASPPA